MENETNFKTLYACPNEKCIDENDDSVFTEEGNCPNCGERLETLEYLTN